MYLLALSAIRERLNYSPVYPHRLMRLRILFRFSLSNDLVRPCSLLFKDLVILLLKGGNIRILEIFLSKTSAAGCYVIV